MSDDFIQPPAQLQDSLPELPHSTYSEMEILVSLLRDDNNWDLIVGEVNEFDFFDEFHRSVFKAMAQLANSGTKIGLASVSGRLQDMGVFKNNEELIERLRDIYEFPTMRDINGSVKNIRAKSMLREVIATAETIAHEAYKQDETEVYDFLGKAEDRIANIGESRGFDVDQVRVDQYLEQVEEQLKYIAEHGKPRSGVLSGFKAIDDMTSGFHRSDLVVIAARPGIGKTTLGLNIAEQVVLDPNQQGRLVFFTLEQPGHQLLLKLVASLAKIDHKILRTERLTLQQEERVMSATGQLLETKDHLLIDQASSLTVSEIRSRVRNIERRIGKLDLVMVDYLQLMSPADQFNARSGITRAQEVALMTRGLKHLAMDLEVPVVVMSQLNRKPTERKNSRPLLADLRDSGAIEQDADLVIMLHRESAENEEGGSGLTELEIAKHRHGPTGRRRLFFEGRYSRFHDYTSRNDEDMHAAASNGTTAEDEEAPI